MNIAKLGLYFFPRNVTFIVVLNLIYLFVLEYAISSRCHFWGFGICKVEYVKYDYAIVAVTLGIE